MVSSFLNITSAISYLLEEGQQVVLIYLYVCLHVSTIVKGKKKKTIGIYGKRKRVWGGKREKLDDGMAIEDWWWSKHIIYMHEMPFKTHYYCIKLIKANQIEKTFLTFYLNFLPFLKVKNFKNKIMDFHEWWLSSFSETSWANLHPFHTKARDWGSTVT